MDPIWDELDPIVWGDDEEVLDDFVHVERRVRREYTMPRRIEVDDFDDVDFYGRFRMTKRTVLRILELIREKLTYSEER